MVCPSRLSKGGQQLGPREGSPAFQADKRARLSGASRRTILSVCPSRSPTRSWGTLLFLARMEMAGPR